MGIKREGRPGGTAYETLCEGNETGSNYNKKDQDPKVKGFFWDSPPSGEPPAVVSHPWDSPTTPGDSPPPPWETTPAVTPPPVEKPAPGTFERALMDVSSLRYLRGSETGQVEAVRRLVETAAHFPPLQREVVHKAIKKHMGFSLGVLRAQEEEYLRCLKASERYKGGGS